MMPRLIGIGGPIGSGKSLAAQFVQQALGEDQCGRLAFADALKRIAREDFGWDGVKDARGRRLLQVIGTEAGRVYNENIWVTKLFATIISDPRQLPFYVIDDCRYPNETDFIHHTGSGITMRVTGRSKEDSVASQHESERNFDRCRWTLELDNSSTQGYLADQVLGALIQHNFIKR